MESTPTPITPTTDDRKHDINQISTSQYKTRPCVLCNNCNCSNTELRPEHTCLDCHKIVHVLCGKFEEVRDKYVCRCIKEKTVSLDGINILSEDQFVNVSTITNSTTGDDTFKENSKGIFYMQGPEN